MNIFKLFTRKQEMYTPIIISPHDTHKQLQFPFLNKQVYFRFGATQYERKEIDLNPIEGIKMCVDKIKMKKAFGEAGVSSPAFFDYFPGEQECPLVLKKREHSCGVGMERINRYKDLRKKHRGAYFEKMIHCNLEFRVHVIGDKIFYKTVKVPKTKSAGREWIRNLDHGYKYEDTNIEFGKDITEDCVRAVKACGLVFGAVDLGVNYFTGEWWIFEVNSAPGMARTKTREAYQKALIEYVCQTFDVKVL
jgi:glutathione synthase/RimK-type ligase-like ATP-grasp enzyme